MKRKGFLIVLFVAIFLSGCQPQTKTAIKEVVDGTNIEPTLYTLEEQREVLKKYSDFYSYTYLEAEEGKEWGTYVIPGLISTETLALDTTGKGSLSKTMDPQGVTVTEKYLLISAYSHDKKHNSVIYVLDKFSHTYIKTVVLQGKPHVGGITYDTKAQNIWVCSITPEGKAEIVSISLAELEKYQLSPDYKPITYNQDVTLKGIKRASYMTYADNALFVGYFSDKHEGILEKYLMDETGKFIEEVNHRAVLTAKKTAATPDDINKVTHGIQGITFYKEYMLLSQSYGPKNSKIFIYEDRGGDQILLDKDAVKVIEVPAYLEQITADQNQLYAVFESGTKRYREKENITKVDRVLKLDLEALIKKEME